MSYLEMAKQTSRQIEEYRAALWRWWTLVMQEAGADEATVQATYDEIIRRTDDLGPDSAMRLRHGFEVEWFRETRRCPRCGQAGRKHG